MGAGLYTDDMDILQKNAERILKGAQLWNEEK